MVLAGHAGIVGAARYAPCLIRKDGLVLQLVAIGCDVGKKGKGKEKEKTCYDNDRVVKCSLYH